MKTISAAKWIGLITVLWSAAIFNVANGGPANPEPTQVKQPDGFVFQTTMRGDEFQGWMETADGYTIVKNPSTGFYEYAAQASGGQLIPSGIRVAAEVKSQMSAQGQMPPKGLRPPRNAALEQYQGEFLNTILDGRISAGFNTAPTLTGTWALTPVSGTKKILVILVGFQDASLSSGAATYWNNAVYNASSASVTKYYQDNSFGTLFVTPVSHTQPGNPPGIVTVSLAQNHPNQGGNYTYSVETAWINSALAAAAPYVNFASLDANGDGTISVDETLVYFVVAGYETSAGSGLTPSYWAHAWGGSGVSVGGKVVNHWALNGERYNASTLMQMGVIAHEMGHAMGGLPDLYDISGNNAGLGIFSLMASGSWGRKSGETGGATPVGLDAWARQYLGWSSPQYPNNGDTISFVSGLSSPTSSVMLMNGASSTSEYWLVENRPPVGWDAGMYPYLGSWTGGLLIQHIDLNVGSKSANSFNQYVSGAHQGNMAEEPSTATCSLKVVTTPSTYSSGCPSILYYSGNSATFNSVSTPNSNYYSGAVSSLGITGISAPGSAMTATVQTTVTSPTCSYAITPTSQIAAASGLAGTVSVSVNTGCAWTAVSNASWITVTSGASGSGNGTVVFSVAANTSASSRSGTLTIGGQTFTITQLGASSTTPTCTLTASPATITSGSSSTLTASCSPAADFYNWSDGSCGTSNPVCWVSPTVTTTYSVSGSNAYGTGNTASATVTVGTGSTTTNQLLNPGFESGATSWTLAGGAFINNNPGFAHAGSYYAYMGNTDNGSYTLSQSVTIPSDAQTAYVQFWYYLTTSEATASSVYDTMMVELYSTSGVKLATLKTLSNLDASTMWVQSAQSDVSAYKGQTVQLRFTATTDYSNPTIFRIDDVVLATSVVSSSTTPTCTLTASPATITSGSSSTLTASCSPAANIYNWSDGSCGTSNPVCWVSPTATTTYSVSGSNAYGTGNTASATVTVGTGSGWAVLPGASPSRPSLALNSGTGKTQMVVRSASDQLWAGNFSVSGNFEGWNQLSGASPSPVAQAWHSGINKLYMVARSASDQLWASSFNSSGAFEGWSALPGASPSPVALAWHPTLNKMYMVVRSASDQLWLGIFNSGGSFEGWSALPGASPSPVALAWHPTLNKMYMVVRSASDQLWLGTFNSGGSFEGWSALPGTSPSPVALAWHPTLNKMYMVVRSASDQLWSGTFNSAGVFGSWTQLEGSTPTEPTLASGQSILQLVVRSANDQLWSMLMQ